MSKSKPATKASKPSKASVLTKVKDAGVAKPSKDLKSKSKAIAKEVAAKEEKKLKKEKKKVKEPTPEPSSESEAEGSSESESSESESEVEAKKPAVNGKAKKAAAKDESESESSESDQSESDSSEDEAPAPKTEKKGADKKANGVKVAAKKGASNDEEESGSSDESDSSEDEAPAPKKKAETKTNGVKAADKKEESSDAESDSSDESQSSDDEAEAKPKANGVKDSKADASDSSDDSSESEADVEEEKPAAKTNKRKAEAEAEPVAKKTKTDDESTGSKNLFVGNLSWNIDEEGLREIFAEFGELSGARLMTDKATGRSKGFGYVEFVKAEDAAAAYEAKKGVDVDGRPLNVDWASVKPDNRDKLENRRKSYGDQLGEPTDTLFVGNLSFDVGQEQVSEAFAPYGTIMSVRLPTDQTSGMLKGFGYVTFQTVDEAKASLEAMQGGYIGNRPVRLDYSQPRPPREDGGRGGGRGGFGGFGGRGGRGDRGGRGGRGGSFGGRGGRGGGRGGGATTNRGGFNDFKGKRQTFD